MLANLVLMQHSTKAAASFTSGDKSIDSDDDGIISIPSELVGFARAHGFSTNVEEKPAPKVLKKEAEAKTAEQQKPPVANSLTTLSNAKAWAGVTTSNDDALLTRLIGSASRFILSYIERPSVFKRNYADVFDGVGQRSQMLRQYPVLSVGSMLIGNQAVPASSGYPNSGYLLDGWDGTPPGTPQRLNLIGYCFGNCGPGGISITYTAGFAIQGEAWTVPSSPYQVTVSAPNGPWGEDIGVTYANGTALVPVSANPSAGQYSVLNGVYTFAAADVNQPVLISYSYIPADIEEACCSMVGERYSYKSRIGYVSKTLAGQETVAFSQKNMPDYIGTLLNPYKNYVPL